MRNHIVVVTAVAALLLAGCGSSDETPRSASAAEVSGGVKAAEDRVAQLSANPTDVGVDEPLPSTPERGKVIVNLMNALPIAEVQSKGLAAAADALGWTYTPIVLEATAEGLQKGFQSAFALKPAPDAIIVSGAPKETYAAQLAEAKERGIAIITNSSTDQAGDGIVASLNSSAAQGETGRNLAAYVVAKSKGEANVAVFHLSAFPINGAFVEGFEDGMKEWCPDCAVTPVDAQVTDIGTAVPQSVVSTVQRDPKISWVVFPFGDMATGVDAALQAAGLSETVTVGGGAPSLANLESLKQGANGFWAGLPTALYGWRTMDALARYFEGVPVVETPMPTQIITKDTVGDVFMGPTGYYEAVKDYDQIFRTLWKVGRP